MVIALVVVLGIRFLGRADDDPVASSSTGATVSGISRGGYLWTDPLLDLSVEHRFEFDIDYDPDAKAEELGMSAREFGDHAFSVYTNPGLTRRAGSVKEFSAGLASVVGNDPQEGAAALNDDFLSGDSDLLTQVREGSERGSWGLHDDYYLVQRLDAHGNELTEPLVTRFTVKHRLTAPKVKHGVDDQGNLRFSWEPVDGATSYLIVKTEISDVVDPDATCRAVTVLGESEESVWSTAESVSGVDEESTTVEYQNAGLELFLVAAENADENNSLAAYTGSEFEYGVIATDGRSYSSYVSQDGVSVAADLPARLSLHPFGDVNSLTAFHDLGTAPTSIQYTAVDGTLRETVAYLDPTTIVEASTPGFLNAVVRVRGSLLGDWVGFESGGGDPAVQVEEYNARAIDEAPPTGLTDSEELDLSDEGDPGETPSPEPQEPEPPEPPEPSPTPEPDPTPQEPEPDPTPQEPEPDPTPEPDPESAPEETEPDVPEPPADLTAEDDYIPPGAPDQGYPVYGSNDFVRYLGASMIAGVAEIDISAYWSQPGAQSIDDAIEEARAQNQYVIGVYSYTWQTSGRQAYVWIDYLETPERIADLQAQVQVKVDEVVGSIIDGSMSDAAKVTAINDYLVATAEYDDAAFEVMLSGADFRDFWYTQDVYGILLGGLGVCASYSRSFDVLADAAGLESVYVTGDVYSAGRHAWNKVKVDGTWLAVDVTWNDNPEGNNFLMIRDTEFTGSADRMEDVYWMNDLLTGQYATP